jgi:TonB family protein
LNDVISKRILWSFVWLVTALAGATSSAVSQETQPTAPSAQQSVGQQAVNLVLSSFMLDPTVLVSKTGKPLPTDGAWSVGKEAPASCPKALTPCVMVLYRVPDAEVSCEWVVLLDNSESKGVFLDANEDAARYLLRKLPAKEAAKRTVSTQPPAYPPMARAAHVTGSVKMTIHVSSTGRVDRIAIIDGPEMLRAAAANAVRQWVYKPLVVGASPIPFQTTVTLNFDTSG